MASCNCLSTPLIVLSCLIIIIITTAKGRCSSQLGAACISRIICLFNITFLHHCLWGTSHHNSNHSNLIEIIHFDIFFLLHLDDNRHHIFVLLRRLWTKRWPPASLFYVTQSHGICTEFEKCPWNTGLSGQSWGMVNTWVATEK